MILPLNIVKTYPVCWSLYQVFRDFVQNFYDSVDIIDWHKAFHYTYENRKLTMWVDSVTFSYEWLMHIGASTKTNSDSRKAGYFGEGFKIASLCALRDFGMKIEMSSATWSLNVIFQEHTIDTQKVEMLAYDIVTTEVNQDKSQLILSPISDSEFEEFRIVLLSFYYPENPMIGEKIWESNSAAVYYRSKEPINAELPFVAEYGRKGIVFCSYQMLGTNPFNLVVCLHNFKKRDRERNALYSFDVVSIFEEITCYVDAKASMLILETMRRYWNTRKKKRIDLHSFSNTIDRLVMNIALSQNITDIFLKKYPHLLCLKDIQSVYENNRRHEAREWLKLQLNNAYTFVRHSFKNLGYPTLEEFCEKNDGFSHDEDLINEKEKRCISILENFTKKVYNNFFIIDGKLEYKIITNINSIYYGKASLIKNKKKIYNSRGFLVRYNLQYVYLKRSLLTEENFFEVLSTYLHELCHMFGGDASHSFSHALTTVMTILMQNHAEVEKTQSLWTENLASANEQKDSAIINSCGCETPYTIS